MKRLCAAVIAWGCLTNTALAVPTLDQEHNPASNLVAFQSAGVMAQTFPVGIAGNLVEVQIMISSIFSTHRLLLQEFFPRVPAGKRDSLSDAVGTQEQRRRHLDA
jgi:hypothetical protein